MGLLNLFKKNNFKKKKYSNNDYVKSKFIYHGNYANNIVILLSFTENYFSDAIELLSSSTLRSKFIQTSIEHETKDSKKYEEVIYYLLIAGSNTVYTRLIQNIENLSNDILSVIILELYENSNSKYFKELIDDGILNGSLFKNKDTNNNDKTVGNFMYNDITKWVKELPEEYHGYHLLSLTNIIDMNSHIRYAGNILLSVLKDNPKYATDDELKCIFNGISKDLSRDNLLYLIEPLYLRDSDNEDDINGYIDSKELDQLFTQEYDRFNAIKDDTLNYVDIDEELSEDDPEYNDVEE